MGNRLPSPFPRSAASDRIPGMRRSLGICLVAGLLLLYGTPSSAFQIGVKGGYHFYPSSDYLDFLDSDQVSGSSGDLNGPSLEIFLDMSVFPMLSVELGLGGYASDADLSALDNRLEMTAAYFLITPKIHILPVSSLDIYAGVGVGYYTFEQSFSPGSALLQGDDHQTGGVHATIGLAWYINRSFVLLLEGRLARAVLEDVGGLGHDLDLGGTFIQGGAAFSW